MPLEFPRNMHRKGACGACKSEDLDLYAVEGAGSERFCRACAVARDRAMPATRGDVIDLRDKVDRLIELLGRDVEDLSHA